jgi:UDP-2,4-diacetamido-2,4,6-trideoxy-beta-L-altropyranose hydrolase
MNVVFRADASLAIGRGHVMRCLTLAENLRTRGDTARFICRPYHGNLVALIKARGHEALTLPLNGQGDVPSAEWLDPDWERDAAQTMAALANQPAPADWLVVDTYALGARWERALRCAARRIMVIDDITNRAHDCEIVLDQNLHRDMNRRHDGLVPSGCRRLLGPRYALLRREFSDVRAHLRERDGVVRRILIFFGGGDSSGESIKALAAVTRLRRPDIEIDVILGAGGPNAQRVRSACAALPRARLHVDPPGMAQLMAAADLSIGAAGSTAWERCCVGLPSIVISLAMNQESIARGLADHGLGIYLGNREVVTSDGIEDALRELLTDSGKVARLSRACAELVDGMGTARAASALAGEGEQ